MPVTLILGLIVIALLPSRVFAACEPEGAYGQTCVFNKTFELEKKTRLEDENTWKDKVIDVKEGEVIEFKITIKNAGDISVDDMRFEDILPDELEKISGNLTEEWNDFKVGEKKTFIIKARIRKVEFDRTDNFEKCVVNKAKVEFDGTLEGADTATVCYGDGDITELPETGPTAVMAMTILGLTSTSLGLVLKRKK